VAGNGEWRYGYAYIFSYIRKQKNRIFMPGPFSLNLLQAQYHDPLLAHIQQDLKANREHSKFYFWGDKIGFQELWPMMAKKIANVDPSHIVWSVRDFHAMDTTDGADQNRKHYVPKVANAFNIAKGTKAYKELEEIMLFSNYMPIATPDGFIVDPHGQASGVTITNNAEGCCNYDFTMDWADSVLRTAARRGIRAKVLFHNGNGDDGITAFYLENLGDFDKFNDIIEKCADYWCKAYGFIKNEKWQVTLGTFGLYCQYELYVGADGKLHADYPVSLALNAGMNPMHEIPKALWDSDYVDWRWAEILTHLYGRQDFYLAIDYVSNGMKRGLFGKTAQDFIRIFSKYKKYRAIRNPEDHYNVENLEWDQHPELNPVIAYRAKQLGVKLG
jgi:hypothetical protein